MIGTHCMVQRQHMDYTSDRVDTTRMDKAAGDRKQDGEIASLATLVLCDLD